MNAKNEIIMVQDKLEKYKYYMMLDGYVVGIQYDLNELNR